MSRWVLVLICALSMTAQAQVPTVTPQMLVPSPLGIVIMVGQWLMQDKRRVYYIRVQGQGATAPQARDNGFRLAVEQAVGTLIVSETQTRNQRMVRDEIITYASGFVDRFEILRTDTTSQGVSITMDVWIVESAIAGRLLNDSAGTGTIDGARLAVQVETLQQERQAGDRLLETVLQDFPRRAFAVQVEKTQVDFDARRTLQIEVPVTLGWNTQYLAALNETMIRTSQSRVSCFNFFKALAGFPQDSDCVARQNRQYFFNNVAFDEPHKVGAVAQYFTQNKPAIQISIVDVHGTALQKTCRRFVFSNVEDQPYNIPNRHLFVVYNQSVKIDSKYQLGGKLSMNLGGNPRVFESANRVDVRVVPEKECSNFQ
jgi:hypothetical protein